MNECIAICAGAEVAHGGNCAGDWRVHMWLNGMLASMECPAVASHTHPHTDTLPLFSGDTVCYAAPSKARAPVEGYIQPSGSAAMQSTADDAAAATADAATMHQYDGQGFKYLGTVQSWQVAGQKVGQQAEQEAGQQTGQHAGQRVGQQAGQGMAQGTGRFASQEAGSTALPAIWSKLAPPPSPPSLPPPVNGSATSGGGQVIEVLRITPPGNLYSLK